MYVLLFINYYNWITSLSNRGNGRTVLKGSHANPPVPIQHIFTRIYRPLTPLPPFPHPTEGREPTTSEVDAAMGRSWSFSETPHPHSLRSLVKSSASWCYPGECSASFSCCVRQHQSAQPLALTLIEWNQRQQYRATAWRRCAVYSAIPEFWAIAVHCHVDRALPQGVDTTLLTFGHNC